jgi:hypothetical protein
VFGGDGGQGHAFGVQHAVLVRKLRHNYCWDAGGVEGTGAEGGATPGLPWADELWAEAGLAGCLGKYSGPVWPQPANRADRQATAEMCSAKVDFTIKIRV